jgi:hypothetical protein
LQSTPQNIDNCPQNVLGQLLLLYSMASGSRTAFRAMRGVICTTRNRQLFTRRICVKRQNSCERALNANVIHGLQLDMEVGSNEKTISVLCLCPEPRHLSNPQTIQILTAKAFTAVALKFKIISSIFMHWLIVVAVNFSQKGSMFATYPYIGLVWCVFVEFWDVMLLSSPSYPFTLFPMCKLLVNEAVAEVFTVSSREMA